MKTKLVCSKCKKVTAHRHLRDIETVEQEGKTVSRGLYECTVCHTRRKGLSSNEEN